MDATAFLGDRSHFYVRIDGIEKPVAVSAQDLDETQTYGENHPEPVWLSWSDKAIVLLNVD
jgi:spermidine/putrescine transport system ATP-binding protein/putrescine transport system ATP-binding protein